MMETPDSPVRLEWIRCNACGADAFRRRRKIGPWEVGYCVQCGLVYVNPMPQFDASSFSHISETFYYTEWQQQLSEDKIRMSQAEFRLQVAQIRSLGGLPGSPGRFLDVGCGPGLAVRAACKEGWDAIGLDIDASLIDLGRQRLAVDVRCTDLLASKLPSQSYDYIRLKFVLEHLPNPRDVLTEVRRILRPGGLLLVVVPNESGFFNRLRNLAGVGRHRRLGTLIPPHHLHAYTPATLRRLLLAARLAPRSITSVPPHHSVYGTLDQWEKNPRRQMLHRILWNATSMVGLGSVLVAWAGYDADRFDLGAGSLQPDCLAVPNESRRSDRA